MGMWSDWHAKTLPAGVSTNMSTLENYFVSFTDPKGLPRWHWWSRSHLSMQETKRDMGSVPGLGRSPGGEHGNPLQYSCLENPMDRGAWRATVHRVTKSHTQLKQFSTHTHTCTVLFFFLCILCSFPEAHHLLEASCSQSPEQVSLAVIWLTSRTWMKDRDRL